MVVGPHRPYRAVLPFVLAGLGAVVVIGLVAIAVLRPLAVSESIRNARTLIRTEATGIIEPALSDGLLVGDPAAIERLDRVVKRSVLGGDVLRVKVWSADGRILYSDEPAMIGQAYPIGTEEAEAMEQGATVAELSDLKRPENRFERKWKQLLEVYSGIKAPNGTPVLYEAYLPLSDVRADGTRLLGQFAPALLIGLLAAWLLLVPLAWTAARRLEESQRQRAELLQRAIDASDMERRRIAADLHDGVVQDLAGASYKLAAAADAADAHGDVEVGVRVRSTASDLRQALRELRSLVVSIAPPRLHEVGLAAAIDDLSTRLAAGGVDVDVDVPADLRLPDATEALVFRGAQEALRNVAAHAEATQVRVRVANGDGQVRLLVRDNGRGFDSGERVRRREEGHVGLSLLEGLVRDAGGNVTIASELGAGTEVRLEVPLR